MKNSFKIATVAGIPVEINISWLIILGLIVFTLAQGYFPRVAPGFTGEIYWLISFISAILLFACLLLHELSHSIVAKRNNLPIVGITLFIFGGVAHMAKEPQSPKVEFKMAAAGPLMSLTLALIFNIITRLALFYKLNIFVVLISNYLFVLNSALVIFNLIPGFPLDGGRILRSILWFFTKDLKKATQIASIFGKGFAFILIGFGFLSLISGSFIVGVWFIFIGSFLYEAAETSYKQLLMKKIFSKTTVADVMSRNVVWVEADETIESLVNNYIFKHRHNTFPVLEDDNIIGIVDFHDIKEIPRSDWQTKTAKDILIPLRQNLTTSPQAHVTQALIQLAANGIGRLLVIENSRLFGILSQKDIIRLFEIKSNLGEG